MSKAETLSENSLQENYAEKGFASLWIRSYRSANRIWLHLVVFILSCIIGMVIPIRQPFNYRQYILLLSDITLTYSSTIIGFLLVSFSILLSLSSVKTTFNYFVKKNSRYKRPLLKVILDHFIFPIGIFLILLISSLCVKLLFGLIIFIKIGVYYKTVFFRLFIGSSLFLILLSITELVSYFYNIYRFIIITSFSVSKEYEEEILNKIYVLHEKIDVLKQDDAQMIVKYQEDNKKNIE